MSKATPKITIITLEHLPAFELPPSSDISSHISAYLLRLASRVLKTPGRSLQLPSISELSVFFKCSPLEMHDALRQLQQQYYEYQLSKFDQPLLIWKKAPRFIQYKG